MATTLLNDVFTYCKDGGSTVYTCSLDAEGAFDAIPHCILFQKAMGVLPDHCWHILINWYSNLNVQIKWCGKYSTKINIHVGTQQSGLSSPYLFNLFYQKLIDLLSKCTGGIQIGEHSYNVFCYADDLVLTSLSVTGLQDLINSAKSFIVSHGLNFNPSKTVCTILSETRYSREHQAGH